MKARVRAAAARWWPLAALTVLTLVLAQVGALPGWPGLAHAVALPPFDLAMDLRVLVARAPGYPELVLGVAASVVLRTAFLGGLFMTLGVTRSPRAAFGYAIRLYAAALVPLAIGAAFEFAGLAALFAWYAWFGLALTVVIGVVLSIRRLARPGTRLRRMPLVVAYLVVLAGLGALGRVGGLGTAVAVVLSAVLTGAALSWLVAARREHGRGKATATKASAASGFVVLVTLVVSPVGAQAPVAPDASLLIVPGVDTETGHGAAFRIDPAALGFPCQRVFYYSYRGPDGDAPQREAACPIRMHRPYAPRATQEPIGQLVDAFDQQLLAIRRETAGAPIVVVSHSQGAVIAWRAVARGRGEGVVAVIALAGFPHSPVGYPLPRVDGPGRIGADALRVVSWFSRVLGFGTFEPDAPLARETLARANGLEDVFAEPLPPPAAGVLLFASADAIVAPEGWELPGGASLRIAATHVGMTESASAEATIRSILTGATPSEDRLIAPVLSAVVPAFMPPHAEA